MTDVTDSELIRQYLAGNCNALGTLYDRHAAAVFGYLRAMLAHDAAEDVLQETFLKAAKEFAKYEERGRLRQWLLSVARNKALDRLRSEKRHDIRRFGAEEEENMSGPAASPATLQEHRETGDRIREAVGNLPEQQRAVFLLREESGLGFKEIAQMLEIPLNTALSHMHRAVQALRTELADLAEA